jgi:pyrimidine operon attenuation protein/uracil phosphoribosyltransferase
MKLPDAEQAMAALTDQMRSRVTPETALVGIHTGGVWIAERLHRELGIAVPLGTLDVSFYRDDFDTAGLHKNVKRSEIPFEVEDRDIVLVDDVLFTGRTIRAALNELFDYGRPKSVRLAALVDRGGRELPVAAQFTGAAIDIATTQSIELRRDANGRFSLVLNED